MASTIEQPTCTIIELIEGLPSRTNTILSPIVNPVEVGLGSCTKRDSHVVYFPGDVQTFAQEMKLHRVGKKWMSWSFENTARILQERFPTSWIWVVNPHRVHEFVFSCYDNFVDCNIVGAPVSFEYKDAIEHLQQLLHKACQSLENILDTSCNKETNKNSKFMLVDPYLPIKLVGFSKGCVVLNQIVFELKQAQESKTELRNFVKQLSEMYWLDGGHSGEENTWVTDKEVLEVLAKTEIGIHVHVTPYQVDDVARPWIAEEHRTFLRILKELQCDVTEQLHFETQERSLKIHFELLNQF